MRIPFSMSFYYFECRLCPSFGLQFSVASGANVIVTSSSNEKLKMARKLGATHTINYKEKPDWEEEVLKIVGLILCVSVSASSNSISDQWCGR